MNVPNLTLLETVRRLMRPIIRLLVKKNIVLQIIVDELKMLYVHEAEKSLRDEVGKATDSHISLVTGVHRKDVRLLRTQAVDTNGAPPPRLSIWGDLLARWLAMPEYSDPNGAPLVLSYKSRMAGEPSFSALAETVSKDIRPRALLEELMRQKIIEYDEIRDTVTLKSEALLPREEFQEKLYYLGLNNGDHLEAAVTNILEQKPAFLDRSVYHDGLSAESVAELQKISTEGVMRLLRQINRKAFELSTQDAGKPDARFRINLGACFFSKQIDEETGK